MRRKYFLPRVPSHKLTREQPNDIATRVTPVPVANKPKGLLRSVLRKRGIITDITVTLSVDCRCPDSKDSRIVRLHIQNVDMLTNQTENCSFTFNQRIAFTPD